MRNSKLSSGIMMFALTIAAAGAATTLTATPAGAQDCGGDYVRCLNDSGAIGTSDALHEMSCYGGYWDCVRSLMLSF